MELENIVMGLFIVVSQILAGVYAYKILKLSREKSIELLYLWPLLFIPGGPGEKKPELLYKLLIVSVIVFVVIGVTELLFELGYLALNFHVGSMLILSILLFMIIYTLYKMLNEAIKIRPIPYYQQVNSGKSDKVKKEVELESEVSGNDS